MNYAYIEDNVVQGLIAEFDSNFPGVRIEQRFAPDFLAKCEPVDDTVMVGYVKTQTGFDPPPQFTSKIISELTLEEIKSITLKRIDGKCSETIMSGVIVNNKLYTLTELDQLSLNAALGQANAGESPIYYAAVGEPLTAYTGEQIRAIHKEAYNWGIVNLTYYALLKTWIAQETNADILAEIMYGSSLPTDLMDALTQVLIGAGINISVLSTLIKTE